MKLLLVCVLVVLALSFSAAAEPLQVPAGGRPILPGAEPEGDAMPYGLEIQGPKPELVAAKPVQLRDGPMGKPIQAVVARVARGSDLPYDAQLRVFTTEPVSQGDVLLAEVWVRGKSDLGAFATSEIVFEEAGGNYAKSFAFPITAPQDEWSQIVVPFRSAGDYAAGAAQVCFRLAYGAQDIEIAGLRVVNYGDAVDVNDLPRTSLQYPGFEQDAPWRAEAEQRIDRLRKGDLTVRVVDASGRPVEGAQVEVEMTRHAFKFGTAINHKALFADGPDGEKYREMLLRYFNYATTENELKWPAADGDGIEAALKSLDWLNDHDITVRGHNLVWPTEDQRYSPDRIQTGFADRAASDPEYAVEWLDEQIRQHILEKATRTRGQVIGWDVANEVSNNRGGMTMLGDADDSDEKLAEWFALGREADPEAEMYLNDYGIIVGGGRNTTLRNRYKRQAQNLIDAGQAPDAIGVQGHFGTGLTSPTDAWAILDDLYQFGIPLEITEFDVISGDETLNGQYTRDFLTACFAHEGVQAFIWWGFWEGRHWRPESAQFRRDWSMRPAGEAMEDLLRNEWWTSETLTTDANGEATVRGFLGDYVLRMGDAEVLTVLARDGRTVQFEAKE